MTAIKESYGAGGQIYHLKWCPAPFVPPRHLCTQVSGVCFDPEGEILLVSADSNAWGIPGGHPEEGESLEDALRREIWEEACSLVEQTVYLGCTRVEVEGHPDQLHYQARYFCIVTPQPFVPEYEINFRQFVEPERFLDVLSWGRSPIAQELLRLAKMHYDSFNCT